jgi:hypothetical protein
LSQRRAALSAQSLQSQSSSRSLPSNVMVNEHNHIILKISALPERIGGTRTMIGN